MDVGLSTVKALRGGVGAGDCLMGGAKALLRLGGCLDFLCEGELIRVCLICPDIYDKGGSDRCDGVFSVKGLTRTRMVLPDVLGGRRIYLMRRLIPWCGGALAGGG